MSVVIIGGNERMVCQYTDICKDYGCKAKVFPKEHGSVKKKIGNPDLMILFTNTVSQNGHHCFPGSKEKQYSDRKNPYQQCHRTSLGIR